MTSKQLRDLFCAASVLAVTTAVGAPVLAQTASAPPADAKAAPAAAQKASTEAAPAPKSKTEPTPTPATDVASEIVVRGKFVASGSGSATKLNLNVLDTPYSVAAYSQSFLQAIQTTQVADLYKYMTGVVRSGSTGYDMNVRGFSTTASDRNAIMTDGLPGLAVRWGSPPTIGADHVELVKGPASLLYGQVQPGGFINVITKKPQATASTTVESLTGTAAGTAGKGQSELFSLDSTGPLSDAARYRLIFQTGAQTGWRNNANSRPLYVAPMLTWDLDAKTSATLQLEYRSSHSGWDNGLVAPFGNVALAAPIKTSYQSHSDVQIEHGLTTSLQATRQFDDGGRLNFSFRDVHHDDRTIGFSPYAFANSANTLLTMRAQDIYNHRTYDYGDLNYTRSFHLLALDHKLIVGANLGSEIDDFNRLRYDNIPTSGAGAYTLSVYNPSFASFPSIDLFPTNQANSSGVAGLTHTHTDALSEGAYVSDFVTLTSQVKALLGARWSREKQDFKELRIANVPPRSSDVDKVMPTLGLLYEPTKTLSFYTSYSTSFVPVTANSVDANNRNNFQPTTGEGLEAGVKSDLFDKRLNVTASVFDIHKKNVTQTYTSGCPVSIGTCTQQIGEQRSVGEELEINAKPLPNWQIIVGATHLKATVLHSNVAVQIGEGLPNVPFDSAHLWTRYDLADGPLQGLGLGFGVSYVGARNGILSTASSLSTVRLPPHTTEDAALYYPRGRYELILKVSNLSDAHYMDSVGTQGATQVMPGEPRRVELTLRAKF